MARMKQYMALRVWLRGIVVSTDQQKYWFFTRGVYLIAAAPSGYFDFTFIEIQKMKSPYICQVNINDQKGAK